MKIMYHTDSALLDGFKSYDENDLILPFFLTEYAKVRGQLVIHNNKDGSVHVYVTSAKMAQNTTALSDGRV